jgi:hypothetical protein
MTVVGVFEDQERADRAIQALIDAGFREDRIGVLMPHDDNGTLTGKVPGVEAGGEPSHAGTGMAAGAITGFGVGALAGVGVLAGTIPVLGTAIAAGSLGVILSNAVAGAGIAGLVGALVGAGVPAHEAAHYQAEFDAGRTIVTVQADDRAAEATGILRHHGADDMSCRGEPAHAVGGTSLPIGGVHDPMTPAG